MDNPKTPEKTTARIWPGLTEIMQGPHFPGRRQATISLAILCLAPLMVIGAQLNKGDHINVTLADGRSFKNAEVVKADGEYVFVRNDNTLTAFKPNDIRIISLTGANASPDTSAVNTSPFIPKSTPASLAPEQPKAVPPAVANPPIDPPAEPIKSEKPKTNNILIGTLSAGLLITLAYALWAKRASKGLNVKIEKLDAFTNELKTKLAGLEIKYSGLIDIDKVKDERRHEIETISQEIRQRLAERETIKSEIAELSKELSSFETEQTIVACGHYRPSFDFNTSEEFKSAIDQIREAQRDLLKNEEAAHCSEKWSVNGSESEGKKATKRTLRLMLRAFNGECDAIIARVSWNNIDRMLERLEAVFLAINKLGESYKCSLAYEYMMMKQRELKLTFEYENKLKKEKDEQRELREQMRDEERARREMEEALKQTAADEDRAKKALEQARLELAQVSGEKEASLNEKIRLLEGRLHEALLNKERAISRAQQTRSGHVYIISNIGSFGETVFKIGMTRRLEPLDRVQELSDASVPFSFDVHAMIYTEDAPTLESKLHQRFDQKRLNLINERKEFFQVTMDELEAAVKEFGAAVELSKLAEAREYRETVERRKTLKSS